MLAILGMIPLRDWLWAALVAALVGYGVYEREHLLHEGAAREASAVQAASEKAEKRADAAIAASTTDYETKLKSSEESYNATILAAESSADALADRVRVLEAASRGPCIVLQGAAPAETGGAGSASGAQAPAGLDYAIGDLIKAAAHDNVVIAAERAERDALTGK